MLHLSLLVLPRDARRWQFLQPYELHQLLWKAFPGLDREASDGRFLYRYDEHEHAHSVLVQSVNRPDWSFIDDEAEGSISRVKMFDPAAFPGGTHLRFFLRANPVVLRCGYTGIGRNGKDKRRLIPVGSDRRRMAERMGVDIGTVPSRDEQLVEWLRRKGGEGGFELIHCTPGPGRDHLLSRSAQEPPITITGVDFEGVVRVLDPAAFARSLGRGIGRAKGFGFGMLSVMRI